MIDEKVGQQHQNHTSKKMSMILMLLPELLAGLPTFLLVLDFLLGLSY